MFFHAPDPMSIPIGRRSSDIFDKRLECISKLPTPVYLVYNGIDPDHGYTMPKVKQLGTTEDGIECPEGCESFTCSHTQVFISKDIYEDSHIRELIAKAIDKGYILGV